MIKLFNKKKQNNVVNIAAPGHIAFICDGNRRWAKSHGFSALDGHRAGIYNFENLVDWFVARGTSTLTFFIFSTENWDRSKEEINFLMNWFYSELKKNLKHANEKNLRYRVIGTRERLPKKLADLCDKLESDTIENTNGTVVFALNYGGQDEIIRAVKDVVDSGISADEITKETFETFLDTGELLPIDMMVRTSNENRISNFLLWKLAYAELMFVPEHWPELVKSQDIWQRVLDEYSRRNRRFGGGKEKDYSGKKKSVKK